MESEDIRPEIVHESAKCHLEQSLATLLRAALRSSSTWLLRLCVVESRNTRGCPRTSAPPAGGACDVHHPETRQSSGLSVSTGRFLPFEPYISVII